ncbi:MAG: hypothetical protein KKE23_02450 [Nanoarchaeota archaeon]|nr:hypothetical protein [Nanoarchaeota archaeon]
MKKMLNTDIALGIGLAILSYAAVSSSFNFSILDIYSKLSSKVSSVYIKHRGYPEIVEERKINGFDVRVARTKSENPVLRVLDDIFVVNENGLTSTTNTGCFDGRVRSTIDLSLIEKDAEEVAKNWESYKKNAFLPANDSSWSFKKQIIYDSIKQSNNIKADYIVEKLKSQTSHELRHANDLISGRYYGKFELELRASLSSLMESTLELSDIEDVEKRSLENSTLSKILNWSGYTWTSKMAFEGFLGYRDTATKYSLSHLSAEEISKRAKEIYDKRYKNFPIVKNTLNPCRK